jgi:steroid delta-isomerase-like uncharacterized protein
MRKWSYAAGTFLAVNLLSCAVEKKPPAPESSQAVVQAYVRAWNEHDSSTLDSLLAPDAIHEDLAQNFRGKGSKQVAAFMRQAIAAEPNFRWKVTNSVEVGRYVVLEWTWTSTYTGPDHTGKKVTKKRISGRGASVAEVQQGKIKRFTDYYDLASFFR